MMSNNRVQIFNLISSEVDRAYAKHGRDKWGRHEFYAILKEEVDEAWDAIKADMDSDFLTKEIVQIAAMCFRYLETGDRYRDKGESILEHEEVMREVAP